MNIKYPPRITLAYLPTPIQLLNNLTRALNSPPIYLKRDDLTGIELTGNKVRKLEFLLADAQRENAQVIVTCGGTQSNHCRATAAACARLGLKCHLILRGKPNVPYDANLLLSRLFGAELRFHAEDEYRRNLDQIVADTLASYEKRRLKAYYFPVGGSVPVGTWGYVLGFEELARQLQSMQITKAHLFCAVGSGGTLAGLILGRALLNTPEFKVSGFNICDSADEFRTQISATLQETIAHFSLQPNRDLLEVDVIDGYQGEGYAIPYPEELEVIRRLARLEGIIFEPVYTGKAFYGMLEQLHQGRLEPDTPLVFIHTGGSFGLFPYRDSFV